MKNISRVLVATVAVSAALMTQGCYEPPERLEMSASDAYTRIADNVRRMMGSLDWDMRVVEEFPLIQKLYRLVDGGMSCSAEMLYDPDTGDPIGPGPEVCAYEPGQEDLVLAFDETGENLLNLLHDYVFVPAQIESEGVGAIILLKPDIFCEMFSNGAEPDGGETTETDEFRFCSDLLTAVPIRLDVYSYWEDSLNIDVLVGESRTFAAGFYIWGDNISVDVDLGWLAGALDIVNNLFQLDDGGKLYDSLTAKGRVAAYISRDYNGYHYIHGEIYDDAGFTLRRPEGEFAAEFDYSVFYIWADADTNEFQVVLSAQDFDASFPYGMFVDGMNASTGDPATVDGSIRVDSDGLDLWAVGKPGEGNIVIQGIGLGAGPFTASHDFDTLFGLELNPVGEHTFDMTLSLDEDGRVQGVLSKLMDLRIDWNLAAAAADLHDIPVGKADETWRILFDGTSPAFTVMDGVDGDWVRVDGGALTVSTSASPESPVVVAPGQCLIATGDDSAPPLTSIAAGECSTAPLP